MQGSLLLNIQGSPLRNLINMDNMLLGVHAQKDCTITSGFNLNVMFYSKLHMSHVYF